MNWALVLGLYLGDVIKGPTLVLGLVLNPFLSLVFGLVFWACAPIILNPISYFPEPLAKASVGKGCIASDIEFLLIYRDLLINIVLLNLDAWFLVCLSCLAPKLSYWALGLLCLF